ncbi:MAG: hypothetical protein ACOVQJ_07785 [Bacteroidia bacterium]
MDAFNPENELIDKYLRGELQGRELDSFLKTLEHDPILKKDVELQQLMVRGIQERGSAELKRYIKMRTTQKRVMRVSYKAWYSAAAALAIILVAAVFILVRQNPRGKNETGMAMNDTANNAPKLSPAATDDANNAQDNGTIAMTDVPDANQSTEENAAASDAFFENQLQENEAVAIAMNIPVIPIRILSTTAAETMSMPPKQLGTRHSKTEGSSADQDESPADSKYMIDSNIARSKADIAAALKTQNTVSQFKLSFANTEDAIPQVVVNKRSGNEVTLADLMVYNLPYDNPQVLNLSDRYFLKAGDRYYEININRTDSQKVKPVTDTQVLAALEK